jgi:uncharacterized glyoxalase superfamily protein PhnB
MPRGNRSAPVGPVIPVLSYSDVGAAVAWLVDVLGFVEQVRIGPGHRAQLSFGAGSLVVADTGSGREAPELDHVTQSVMLRVVDIEALWDRALARGAEALAAPTDMPYGERQCSFRDPGGHLWTLTETLEDVRPEDWGGISVGG